MRTDEFDYRLPQELIAQNPVNPRDSCRLLVLDRQTGECVHRGFRDIADYLHEGDVVVVNETRVLPARLKGRRRDTGGFVEVLLLRAIDEKNNVWECLVKPGRRIHTGSELVFGGESTSFLPQITACVDAEREGGLRTITFTAHGADFNTALHRLGTLPLPPYITDYGGSPEQYQTVYGVDEHSAAAPTAGLHFTPELLANLQSKGIGLAKIRLDVGLDTFRPVSEDDPGKHTIHTEYYQVPKETLDLIDATRKRGKRVIAVGTTVVRSLESAHQALSTRSEQGISGNTSLYILPGFEFQVTDVLLTNFHIPRSTLMMLVSAFAGREQILAAYAEAVREKYRFLSFGDAMLIL